MSAQIEGRSSSVRRAALSRPTLPQVAWAIFTVFVAAFVLMPLVPLVVEVFAEGFAVLDRTLQLPNLGETLLTTALLAVGSGLVATVGGVVVAWSVSTLPPKLRTISLILCMLPLAVPAVAAVIGWTFLLTPRVGYINQILRATIFRWLETGPVDIYSVEWIILITGFELLPFMFLFAYNGLRSLGSQYEQASFASGAGPLRTFFTVTLPLLRPSLLYGGAVVSLLGLGQFTAPLLLGRGAGVDVISTELFRLTQEPPLDRGVGAALGLPLIVAGAIITLLQRKGLGYEGRFIAAGGKGMERSSQTKRWPLVIVAAYFLLSTVLPVLALLHVSLSPFWTGKWSSPLTTRHFSDVLSDPFLTSAIQTSVVSSVLAVVIVLPVAMFIVISASSWIRTPRIVRRTLDAMTLLPLATPRALFGFGALVAYTRPPLEIYGTVLILIVVYATIMLPYGVQYLRADLVSIGPNSWEAGVASGANPLRNLVEIVAPQVRRAAAATAAIIFILLFHEFSASVFVRSVDTQVMGTVLYDLFTSGIYPRVAVLALIMVAVTMVGVGIALILGERREKK